MTDHPPQETTKNTGTADTAPDTSTLLNRDAIVALVGKPDLVKVNLPEAGGHVYVKAFTAGMRDEMEFLRVMAQRAGRPTCFRAIVCFICCCDADGKRLFTPSAAINAEGDAADQGEAASLQDVDRIDALGATVLEPVYDAVLAKGWLQFLSAEDARKK